MNVSQTITRLEKDLRAVVSPCEHRTVSRDGRIVCRKIVEGDNEVSPNVCRACPLKTVNCAHLCFSLRQTSPTPLVVRFNGRTEIWDDEPPEVCLEQAACGAKVTPIQHPKQCASCTLRQPLQAPVPRPERSQRQVAAGGGQVVAFPGSRVAAAAG